MPTSASRAQKQLEGYNRSQVSTPNSLDGGNTKRKNWMASASKRLGIMNSRTSKLTKDDSRSQWSTPSPYASLRKPEIPSHIPVKRSFLSSPLPSRRGDPSDKPLPSLPVATIISNSPIHRRSLIDATERPLRRSLSPDLGLAETDEWPSLSPERPTTSMHPRKEPAPIKPGIGESVIEGIRQLNLNDDSQIRVQGAEVCTIKSQVRGQPMKDPILEARCSSSSSSDSYDLPPRDAARCEPPRTDTTAKTGLRQKTAPSVRQTKTSAMRMRLSGGSADGADLNTSYTGKNPADSGVGMRDRRISPHQNLSANNHDRGPVRSTSRSRHAATPRGSPYLVPSRSNAKLIRIKRKPTTSADGDSSFQPPRSGSIDSTEDCRQSSGVAVKSVKGADSEKRRASIALPNHLIRRFPDQESEADVAPCRLRRASVRRANDEPDSQDADIDTDPEPKPSRNVDTANGDDRHSHSAKHPSNLLNFTEVMGTPPPATDDSVYSNDSSEGSVHGYDEDGGFKIKKLPGQGRDGATLRISDSAHRLLSPDHADDDVDEYEADTKRSNITDLRQAVVLKEHLRRSGGLIKSQIQLTRSMTERSLARLSGVNLPEADPNDVVDSSTAEHASVRHELPSSPVELTPGSSTEHLTGTALDNTKGGDVAENRVAGTPSSAGRGDWPLKDFKTLATTTQTTPGSSEASLSPWIPPHDWDVADNSVAMKEVGTPCPPVAQGTPATDLLAPHYSNLHECTTAGQERVPTPRPNQGLTKSAQMACTDPVKRPYPPRTTSKHANPQRPQNRVAASLSPVKESPERVTGLRQAQKPYGNELGHLTEPKHVKTFSESLEDINQNLNAIGPLSSASQGAPTSSGKKTMSTLRGLFRRKSIEFRSGSRRAKKQGTNGTVHSSPLLATPTPYQSSSLFKGLAPLQPDAITPLRNKSMLQCKPTPAAKSCDSAPAQGSLSLGPPEIVAATQTALKLLEMAREERPGPRRNQLVELGKATIEVVNAARGAEKALEEAKQATAKAEIQALTSKKAVVEVASMVEKLLGGSE